MCAAHKLTEILGLLGVLVVRQIVAGDEDGDGKAVLQRQAHLVKTVQSVVPE